MNLLQNQSLKMMLVFGFVISASAVLLSPLSASAQDLMECGDVQTSIIDCKTLGGEAGGGDSDGSHIFGLLILAINIMTAGIGIVSVGGLVYGALLYTSAGDKQDQVQKALGMIKNVVIGLIAYFALFAFVQFLIPGGVFNTGP